MAGTLFIVSAPSCAGKTTLLKALSSSKSGRGLEEFTTYTTKPPREGDVQGRDFHFVSVGEFKKKIAKDYFIEWSNAYTNYYGTPKSIVDDLRAGISYTIILDRTGARQVFKAIPSAVLIWIYVSDIKQLEQRIRLRAQDSLEQITLRLRLAREEMAQEAEEAFYKYHIKNDDFNVALGQLEQIIRLYLPM